MRASRGPRWCLCLSRYVQITCHIHGGIWRLTFLQCMLNVIWLLKACMLFMFARVLTETSVMKWIQAAAAWVAMGWVAVQITFFTTCRPFAGYWAMPPPNEQCATLQTYAIVQSIFNISSDLLLIAIPIPVIMSLSLPPKQKIGLVVLFSMGTFVVCSHPLFLLSLSHLSVPSP